MLFFLNCESECHPEHICTLRLLSCPVQVSWVYQIPYTQIHCLQKSRTLSNCVFAVLMGINDYFSCPYRCKVVQITYNNGWKEMRDTRQILFRLWLLQWLVTKSLQEEHLWKGMHRQYRQLNSPYFTVHAVTKKLLYQCCQLSL